MIWHERRKMVRMKIADTIDNRNRPKGAPNIWTMK